MPVGFRIDTGQARTDLYKSDPFDMSIAERNIAQQRSEKFAAQQAEKKGQQDRIDDIQDKLLKANPSGVLDRERPMFAKMQSDLYDDVKKNIGKIKAGDTSALLDIQQKLGDINTQAELSKNTRTQLEKYASEMLVKGNDKYRKSSVDYLHDYATNPEHNGKYDFDASKIGENFDYNKHVNDNLFPYAEKVAKANESGYSSDFTPEQAKQTIKDDITSNPIAMQQANDDYEAATDKLGAKDAIEYMQNKYSPKLVIHSTKPTPEWMNNGSSDKNDINVTHTVNDNGGEVHMMNDKTNEEVTVQYDKKGNVIGGVQKTRLSPDEHSQNEKIQASNIAKKKEFDKKMADFKIAEAQLNSNSSKADQDAVRAMIPDPNIYKPEPLPFKENKIVLDKKQALEVAHDKYGVSAPQVIAGKKPAHVNIQHVDNRKKDEVVWTYNGTSAPESDWLASGWTPEKLQKHAKKK